MSGFKPEDAYPPQTSILDTYRRNAIQCFAGGLLLIAVLLFSKAVPALMIVAGGIACATGAGWFLANNPVNRKTGVFIFVLGVFMILSRLPPPLLRGGIPVLLSILAMWLLVTGVRNVIMYFISQGKRFR